MYTGNNIQSKNQNEIKIKFVLKRFMLYIKKIMKFYS